MLSTPVNIHISFGRIWTIRRLKASGANNYELIDVYNKQVRNIIEQTVANCAPSLTLPQAVHI